MGRKEKMTKRVKRNKAKLCFLQTCSSKDRKYIIKSAKSDLINAIGDVALTTIKGGLSPAPQQRKILRHRMKTLKELATKQRTIAQKKKILSSQQGGAILPILLGLLKDIFL